VAAQRVFDQFAQHTAVEYSEEYFSNPGIFLVYWYMAFTFLLECKPHPSHNLICPVHSVSPYVEQCLESPKSFVA
jgi:hypothetical protein